MALVSKSEASRLTGKSRATIYRHIKEGKLSEQDGQLDTSELIRVYGEFSPQPDKVNETPGENVSQNTLSHRETEQYNKQISQLERQLDDVKQDRDHWRTKTDELTEMLKTEQETTKLLTHQGEGKKGNGELYIQITLGIAALGLMAYALTVINGMQ